MTTRYNNTLLIFGGDSLGAGGFEHSYLNDVWRLDLARGLGSEQWQKVEAAEGGLQTLRQGLQATCLVHSSFTSFSHYTPLETFTHKKLICMYLRTLPADEAACLNCIPDNTILVIDLPCVQERLLNPEGLLLG